MQPELNSEDFAEHTVDAEGKVVVEFFATWCPHCQRQQPITDEAAEILKGKVKFYQVDVDKEPMLTQEYAPEGFPTYVLFEDGECIGSHTGEISLQELLEIIEDH